MRDLKAKLLILKVVNIVKEGHFMDSICCEMEFAVNNLDRCFFINGLSGFPTLFKGIKFPYSVKGLIVKYLHSILFVWSSKEFNQLKFDIAGD